MSRILVLGAGGRIARHAIEMLGAAGEKLTLFARHSGKVRVVPSGASVVEGDVTNGSQLSTVMRGQHIVYANLSGNVDEQARHIIDAMRDRGVRRLIFIASLGVHREVPGAFGEWNERMIGTLLAPYRRAVEMIEASELDYTIVRPAWLTDAEEVNYLTTERHEPFGGTEVSRRSVAAYIAYLVAEPGRDVRTSIGLHRPGSQAPKPSFFL